MQLKNKLIKSMFILSILSSQSIYADHHLGERKVSYYGKGFHGKKMANGDRFNMYAMTVAHKYLPFGTKLKLTCGITGKTAIAKVTDRGPYIKGRDLDLSYGLAKKLGIVEKGVSNVKVDIVQ